MLASTLYMGNCTYDRRSTHRLRRTAPLCASRQKNAQAPIDALEKALEAYRLDVSKTPRQVGRRKRGKPFALLLGRRFPSPIETEIHLILNTQIRGATSDCFDWNEFLTDDFPTTVTPAHLNALAPIVRIIC